MDDIKINGKAIYTTKGAAREYGRVGCNFYTGCPHECEYCYLKRGAPSKQLGGNVVRLKKCFKDEADALEVFKKEVKKHVDVLRKTGVFFSFTTDPLIPETRTLTVVALQVLMEHDIPAQVLTKDTTWMFDEYVRTFFFGILPGSDKDIRLGFTLTGHDDMEQKASSNAQRISVMRLLKENHPDVKTWASIEPVIDWQHANMVVEMSLDCCDHYKIGLRSGVKKDYYDLVGSGARIESLVKKITGAGRTVYLKKSARKLLRRCYKEDYYNGILSRTVDMDGNLIAFTTTNQ
jgi:DNA repair photolyase